MKTIFLLLTGLFAFSCQIYAQSFLSPRVGNEIDQVEREYFGLFPTDSGFVSAKATSQSGDLVNFKITTLFEGRQRDTSISIKQRILDKLSNFIEEFESVRINENEVNLDVLQKVAAESPAIKVPFQVPHEASLEMLDRSTVTGKLFWADDSTIVLWKSDEPYNWRTFAKEATLVSVSSVSKITVVQNNGFRKGAIYGLIAWLPLSIIYISLDYENIGHFIEHSKSPILPMLLPLGTLLACEIVGGIIGSILQQDFHATIDGNIEKYLPNLKLLTNSSVIQSYPPPEVLHLIRK
ncbi:MAG: hypothetical protein IPM69_00310 [Ignavibacteria bacterium]|nr:hypothetical protein [Ignavibacteria bacterium]